MWSVTEHLSEDEWDRIARSLHGRTGLRARGGGNARRFINAVIWVARTRVFWSDLPPTFGSGHTVYMRFLRWMRDNQWPSVIEALNEGPMKEDIRNMVHTYVERDTARDIRRKVLAGHVIADGAMLEAS